MDLATTADSDSVEGVRDNLNAIGLAFYKIKTKIHNYVEIKIEIIKISMP